MAESCGNCCPAHCEGPFSLCFSSFGGISSSTDPSRWPSKPGAREPALVARGESSAISITSSSTRAFAVIGPVRAAGGNAPPPKGAGAEESISAPGSSVSGKPRSSRFISAIAQAGLGRLPFACRHGHQTKPGSRAHHQISESDTEISEQ